MMLVMTMRKSDLLPLSGLTHNHNVSYYHPHFMMRELRLQRAKEHAQGYNLSLNTLDLVLCSLQYRDGL